jgi:hypothetical protein
LASLDGPTCEPFFFFLPILVLAYLSNQRWSAWPHLSFCHIKKHSINNWVSAKTYSD